MQVRKNRILPAILGVDTAYKALASFRYISLNTYSLYDGEDSSIWMVPEMLKGDNSNLKQINHQCVLKDAYFSEGTDIYINTMIDSIYAYIT